MGVKVLITGTSGYLGSVLASQLANMPEIDSITGIDNASPRVPLPDKVKFIKMDIRSPEITDVMRGHDFVIHTACVVHWPAKMPKKVLDDINLNGTRNVAQAAVKNQVRGFLQASSCAAYDQLQVPGKDNISEDFPLGKGNSPFYYWNTKCKCEKILSDTMASSKVTLTVFRLGTVIGPSIPISLQVLRQDALEVPGIDCRVQYIHEDDVAQVFAQAIRTPMPGAFNVVPDDFVRTSEYHKIIGAKIVTAPLWLALFVTYIRWRFFGSIFHPSWIRAYMMDFTLSNAKLKATGWEPKYTGEEAIRTVLGKRAGRKKTKKRLESSSVQ